MRASVRRMLDIHYPMGPDGIRHRNGTKPFYDWFLGAIDAGNATVLNVGAGPTPPAHRCIRGKVKRVIGVDPDPVVLSNADMDEAYVNDGIHLPFDENTFDSAYSDWTLEHVPQPGPFLKEVLRVLKPGASYWFRTSNRWHYVTVLAALTPQWFHRLVANRARTLPANAHEPWPTRYRMNTPTSLPKALTTAGFESVELRLLEGEPTYLQFNPLAFRLGVQYERLVNRSPRLARFRLIMFGRARKPDRRPQRPLSLTKVGGGRDSTP